MGRLVAQQGVAACHRTPVSSFLTASRLPLLPHSAIHTFWFSPPRPNHTIIRESVTVTIKGHKGSSSSPKPIKANTISNCPTFSSRIFLWKYTGSVFLNAQEIPQGNCRVLPHFTDEIRDTQRLVSHLPSVIQQSPTELGLDPGLAGHRAQAV